MHIHNPLGEDLVLRQGLGAKWAAFGERLDEIEAGLAGLPTDTKWKLVGTAGGPAIGVVTAADFAAKFGRINWSLCDDDFYNGGVGEVASRWADPVHQTGWLGADQRLNASAFEAYYAEPGTTGLTYLALHETAHVTEFGLQINRFMWDQYCHRGGDPAAYANSPEWTYNEAVANLIVLTVARALELTPMDNPGGGYPQLRPAFTA